MNPVSRLLLKVRQKAWLRAQALNTRVHDLRFLYWEATLRCNLRCRHCLSSSKAKGVVSDLPAGRVVETFRDIAAHYEAGRVSIGVTGGEPLLREDLFEILSEARHLGFPWGLATNGTLAKERLVEKCVRTGMQSVAISLDGDETTHNWMRGDKAAYRRAWRALRLFLQAASDTSVRVTTCVHQGNVHQLPWLRDQLRELGVHSWRLYTISPQGRAAGSPDLWPTAEVVAKTLALVREQRRTDSTWPVSYAEDGYLGCELDHEVRDAPGYCGAGIHVGGLLADGSYSACTSLRGPWVQGHVDELPFSEAWESRYQVMRNREWLRTAESCTRCRAKHECPGPSLHLWDWETGRPTLCVFDLLDNASDCQSR